VQEAKNEVLVPAEEVNVFTTTGMPVYNFSGTVPSSLGGQAFTSNSQENPTNEGLGFAESSGVLIEIETRQTVNYLSLPVTLDYLVDAYPWRFFVGGGISVNQVIGSQTEYTVVPEIEEFTVQESNDFNGTYLAFHAGFGVDYLLSDRLSIRLNPSYRGWMNPIFENDEIKTLPFGIALRGGLVYRLKVSATTFGERL
jgi:hypothetical protein